MFYLKSDEWKFTQYMMHGIEIHKVLQNGPEIKTIPPFKRGEHINTNIWSENKFDIIEIPKKGDKPKI